MKKYKFGMIGARRKICLFGIGVLFKDCYRQIVLSLGREPDVLCDNSPAKWGKKFWGRICITPDELAALADNPIVVITVKRYEDIHKQLRNLGLKDIFIVCYDRGYNLINAIKKIEPQIRDSLKKAFESPVTGKWTLVTGASRGIGRLVAMEMAMLGANIVAHSRNIEHSRKIADHCAGLGVKTVPVAAELSNLREVDKMLLLLEQQGPQIDIIFNNAGISPACPDGFWNMPDKDYLDCFTVNALAPIKICRRLIPPMVQRGYGRIINVSSSIQRRPGEMAYACSKAALDKFVHDLAPSLEGTGVTLSLVDPGWLRTEMGGEKAPLPVESVIPGVLLGALLDNNINGRWFSAQDYAGLNIQEAIQKAKFLHKPLSHIRK